MAAFKFNVFTWKFNSSYIKYDSFVSIWAYVRNLFGCFCVLFLFILLADCCAHFLSVFYVYFDFKYFGENINVIGASGAICVLIGFYAVIDKNSTKGLIVAILLMSFVPLLMGVNVAWYGHIFGFMCGYILAKIKEVK